MEKLYDKSLTELHDLLVSKEITAVDLTEETGTCPAATAEAEPPEEPPGTLV